MYACTYVYLFACVAIDCGIPGIPDNGGNSYNATTYSSTARYSCNVNFELVGTDLRQCQLDGTWSGAVPVCRRIRESLTYFGATHTYMYIHMYTHMYTHTHTNVHTHTYTHVHTHTHTHMYTHTHTCVHTHTHMHACIQTHTHKHTHSIHKHKLELEEMATLLEMPFCPPPHTHDLLTTSQHTYA